MQSELITEDIQSAKPGYALDKKKRNYIVRIINKMSSPVCFEWGCGFSTEFFLRKCPGIRKWISIENNLDWFKYLSHIIRNDKLTIKHIPSTEERDKKKWWEMENTDPRELVKYFSDYINSVREYEPDFILIDGRTRLQCFETALGSLSKNGTIVMDDSHRIYRNKKEWEKILSKFNIHKFCKKMYSFTKKQ